MSVMSDTSFIYSLYSLVSQVPPTSWKPRPREMVPKEKPSDCRKGDTTGHTWQRGAGLSNTHTPEHCRAALLAPHHDCPVDVEPQGVGVLEAASHDDAAGDEETPPDGAQPGVRLHRTGQKARKVYMCAEKAFRCRGAKVKAGKGCKQQQRGLAGHLLQGHVDAVVGGECRSTGAGGRRQGQ